MSYRNDNIPCGYHYTGERLTFSRVKKFVECVTAGDPKLRGVAIIKRAKIIPIEELSENQRQNLAIDCWNHGLWYDIVIGDDQITKDKAIAAVKERSALGKKLVHLVMTGYTHIYKSLLPHDEKNNPLVLTKFKWLSASSSSPMMTPESGPQKKRTKLELPVVPEASTLSEPESVASASPSTTEKSSVMIYNNLSFTVYIYSYSEGASKCISDIPAGVKMKFSILKYDEPLVAEKDKMDSLSRVVSAYVTHRGCTTWNIDSFPVGSLFPSFWKMDQEPWVVRIKNYELKTYVCIWQVLPNGSLHFIRVLPHHSSFQTGPLCYIGTSLVATQGGTVISKFFADSTTCTEWSICPVIETCTAYKPVTYRTGDNNYIFYQVSTLQDDMIIPVSNNFSKKITIPPGVKFLYASLVDPYNAYFSVPEGVTVTIDSQDATGAITHYNSDTNTESLYIQMGQMTAFSKTLQKLCVKDPTAGIWTINIESKTNTPVFFQFQTVPTKDPYDTMKKTLSKLLGLLWNYIAYAGFTNICNLGGDNDIVVMPVVAAIGTALFIGLWTLLYKSLQNSSGDIKKAISTVCSAVAPPRPNLPDILLVDANGDDEYTKRVYEGRAQFLYPEVELGVFQQNFSKLVGELEATRDRFLTNLANTNLKLVSVAGHGKSEAVYGYLPRGAYQEAHVILNTTDVKDEPERVNGKIFHFYACCTATNLGPELDRNKAMAYVGYNKELTTLVNEDNRHPWMIKPDCSIDLSLIEGKTVQAAVNNAKSYYKKLIIKHRELHPQLIGILEGHCNALTVIGNLDARLVPINNSTEEQQSTGQDEQH